jgi:hypothetical protein
LSVLEELLKDATAGDPLTGLKWTRKTVRALTRQLRRRGFRVGRETVRRLLRSLQYALRVNRKRQSRRQDPERDQQMRHMLRQRRSFLQAQLPVISVDTKKKELVGNFKNPGRTWRTHPLEVLATDFASDASGKAIPYGIYDLQHNSGFVVVGTSHETAQFAVASIRTWWKVLGRRQYPQAKQLLIEADGGGANGSRSWVWKAELQKLADEFQLTIMVSHLPPSASKWNLADHRLFCHISQNWAGQPLVDYETILKFIRTTKTETGLRCRARLDRKTYPTGVKLSMEEKAKINLRRHRVLPKWNYTIKPH